MEVEEDGGGDAKYYSTNQQWRSWGHVDARACLGVANYIMGVFNYYLTNVQDHTVVVELVLSIAVVYSI